MKLRYFRYRFPFSQPFQTNQNTFNTREGILLKLEQDGFTAYGEAAPLPGFSHENLDQVQYQLKKYSPLIVHLFKNEIVQGDLDDFYKVKDIVPSLCFALDTLACNYEAQKIGFSVSRLLFDDPLKSVPVNTVITMQPASDTMQQAKQRIEEGYETLKLKIGRNFTEEISILKDLRNRFPDITLRVDANRSWSLDEAQKYLEELGKLDIEYCEEPLDQPSLRTLEKLSASSPVPVALDESLNSLDVIESVAEFIPVLVFKPMVIGRISNFFATKHLAGAHENKIIYTTALESGVGRMMTAILASGLGARQSAHGLATGSFLKVDVWHDTTYINNGSFSLPGNSWQNKGYRSDLQNIAEEIHF